jgi:hypothetical protein
LATAAAAISIGAQISCRPRARCRQETLGDHERARDLSRRFARFCENFPHQTEVKNLVGRHFSLEIDIEFRALDNFFQGIARPQQVARKVCSGRGIALFGVAGMKTVLDDLGAKNPKIRELKPEDLLETRFLRNLKESGAIK